MKEEYPVLQVALDFINLKRALKVAEEAVAGGADWVEAGTPLIKSEGMNAVRALRERFADRVLVADLKTFDAGRLEVESAAKSGADVALVMGCASESTLRECVRAGANYGIRIGVDLLGTVSPVDTAKMCEQMGVHHVCVHLPIDRQMLGETPLTLLEEVRRAVEIPVAVAGGINSETAAAVVNAGADIVVVGGAISKSKDAAEAARNIKRAISTGIPVESKLYRRVKEEEVREVFMQVSCANISDGAHRMAPLGEFIAVVPGAKAVGRALTVRTAPGDWAKPVEAIDSATEGDILVVDAGGVPPAVWGELATHSALNKRLAGVVIHGAVRDVGDIRKLGLPVFARCVTPQAGEPRGFGQVGVPVTIGGRTVMPGDWVVADEDGVVVVESRFAVEVANRAMDCLERENRIREEIVSGKTTLSQVMELLRWEKKT